MRQGVVTAWFAEGFLSPAFNGAYRTDDSAQVALPDDVPRRLRHGFHASPRAVGDDGGSAGDGLQVDGGVIVLPGGVDEGRRGGVQLRQLVYVFRAADSHDVFRKPAPGVPVHADQHDHFVIVQHPGQTDEVVKPFLPAPHAGHAEQDMSALQVISVFYRLRVEQSECFRVYTVVDDAHVVAAEERPLHLTFYPFRHGDDDHPACRYGGEGFALVGVVTL